MDKRICVYEAGETDFASNGLGPVSPTECVVNWEENGEYALELTHPIDEWGKYERLCALDRVIVAPVPEAPSMALRSTGSTTTVETYTIATRKSRLRLRAKPTTSSKCLGYYAKGKTVTLIDKTSSTWYEVTAPDGKHGYMYASYLTLSGTTTVGTQSTELVRDVPMRAQPFDIYAWDPEPDSVTVKARHVFYRLAENVVTDLTIEDMTAQEALDALFGAAENQDHGFSWTAEDTDSMSLEDEIQGKTVSEVILGDGGICETYGLKLLVDWFDIFLVSEIGENRGVQLRCGKNLSGLEGGFDGSGIVTRVIPIGQTKDGEPLYLSGTNYVESDYADDYTRPKYGCLTVSQAKVGNEVDGETLTKSTARTLMKEAAQAELDAGCDLPECSITANMTLLRDDPAYSDYEALERICPGDTLSLFVPDFGLTLTLELSAYEFDALSQRYNDLTLGSPAVNMTSSGISSRLLKSGSVTSSKLAANSVTSSALCSDVVAARHVQADSINTSALQAASVTTEKLAAGSVTAEKLDADTVNAEIANIVVANLTTANIESADVDWASIETLTSAFATLVTTYISEATIESAQISDLEANVAAIATVLIASASITSAQIEDLSATILEAVHAEIETGEFTLAEITNLLANALVLEAGVADSMYITNLSVTSANLLNAVIGDLVLCGDDGNYYRVFVSSDGTISTEQVTVTDDEIAAGETSDGYVITATTANVESLSASTVLASQAVLETILTESLTAGSITAGEALLASATIPELYVTSIKAIGDSIDISANVSITSLVSSVTTVESAAATAQETAETASTTATEALEAAEAAQTAIDEMEVGATNLLPYTQTMDGWYTSNGTTVTVGDDGYGVADFPAVSTAVWESLRNQDEGLTIPTTDVLGKTVTFSFDYRVDDTAWNDGRKLTLTYWVSDVETRRQRYRNYICTDMADATDEWQRYSHTLTITDSIFTSYDDSSYADTDIADLPYFGVAIFNYQTGGIQVRRLKLELGNTATDWSPAPGDAVSAIEDAQETADTALDATDTLADNLAETDAAVEAAANTADEALAATVTLSTQITQTAEGVTILQTQTTELEDRVETIESGVHIEGAEISIYTSDSPYKNTITNDGWEISENGTVVMTAAETKLTAPRVQVTDALIIGSMAWKPGNDSHLRLLKYGS